MAKIGLQLYTIREEAQKDFFGTLRRVAEMGYDGVEFAGYYDTPARELRATLDDLGLEAAGTHIGVDRLEKSLPAEIAYARAINCPAIVCPGFWGVDYSDINTFIRMGQLFDRVGASCRAEGLRFLYHVHGHEFVTFDGQYGLDVMLARIDPAHMTLEPDTYWIEKAGLDALAFFQTYGERCAYIHCKDMKDRQSWRDTEVGAGALDFPAILRQGQRLGITWYIVEQEAFDRPMMESVAISLKNLRALAAA